MFPVLTGTHCRRYPQRELLADGNAYGRGGVLGELIEWPFDLLLDYWFRVGCARKAARLREAEERRENLEVVE